MGARSRPVARTTSSGDITRGRIPVDSGACVSSRPTTGSKKVFWKTRRCAVCHWRKDCKTEKEAKEYWKKGGTCKGKKCKHLQQAHCPIPGVSAPDSSNPSTPGRVFTPQTPPTVSKMMTEDENNETQKILRKQIDAFRVQVHRMDLQMTQLRAKIMGIDWDNDETAAREVITGMQKDFNAQRGSYKVSNNDNAIGLFLHSMRGKKEQEANDTLKSLLNQWDLSLATKASHFLQAREQIQEKVRNDFKDKVMDTNPLDNMVEVVVHHPNRLFERWRVEFARWCDFSRNLIVKPGTDAQKSFRWSPLVKKFWTSMKFFMPEKAYEVMTHGLGCNPDHESVSNLHAPHESTIRRAVQTQKQSHEAGLTPSVHIQAYIQRAGVDAKYRLESDAFDLKHEKLRRGALSGEGEAHMGNLSDVPDRDERLAWARDVHALMRLKDDTANLVDRQFHSRAVYQALQECMVKARQCTHSHATALQKSQDLQVKHAVTALKHTSNTIDADQTWADLDSLRRSGAAYLQPYIEFTSSMAKHQGKIDEMAKVISSGRQLLIALDDYIASSLSVSGDDTSMSSVESRFIQMSKGTGGLPLFDAKQASQRWATDSKRAPVQVAQHNGGQTAVLNTLPGWFCECYSACMRVEADQAISCLLQDVQRLLPPLYVSVVYVPKQG